MYKKSDASESVFHVRESDLRIFTAAANGAVPEKIAKTKITLSITQEDSEKVKIYALKNHTTVSDLLHEWIQEKCVE